MKNTRVVVTSLIIILLLTLSSSVSAQTKKSLDAAPQPLYGGDNPGDARELNWGDDESETFWNEGEHNWYHIETRERGTLLFKLHDIDNGDDLDLYLYDYTANQLLCSSTRGGNRDDICIVEKDNNRLWEFYIDIYTYDISGLWAEANIYTGVVCEEGWVSGEYCGDGNGIYRDWQNDQCVIEAREIENCDNSNYAEPWGSSYCAQNGNLKQSRISHNFYCSSGDCRDDPNIDERTVESCNYGCRDDYCLECTQDNHCANDEKCQNNICVEMTCDDYPGTYGSCQQDGQMRRDGDYVYECGDQLPWDFSDILCWELLSQKGDDDFCLDAYNAGDRCNRNDFDCDPLQCAVGLQCAGPLSGLGFEGGCCYDGEEWDKDANICFSPCEIDSVTWDITAATEGDEVGITVIGNLGCANEPVDFEVYEIDCFFFNAVNNEDNNINKQSIGKDLSGPGIQGICRDEVDINPEPTTFDNSGTAHTTWTAEYHKDFIGESEFGVQANTDDDDERSSNRLTVAPNWGCIEDIDCDDNELIGDPYCIEGDLYQTFESGICNNHICVQEGQPQEIESCELGCLNGACIEPFCGDNICQDNEDYNSCQVDCENPCRIPDGTPGCTCNTNEECAVFGDLYCNLGICQERIYEDECNNHDQYFCELGWVKQCVNNGNYWEEQKIDRCSGKYEYCNPETVEATGNCARYEDFDIWIDHAETNVIVNKQPGDLIKINIYSQQTRVLDIRYDPEFLEDNCIGPYQVIPGLNTCEFRTKNDAVKGEQEIRVGDKYLTINIVEDPDFLIITDSEKLLERFPQEENGVKAVLKQAYVNAGKDGVVYDLDWYDLGEQNPFTRLRGYIEKILRPSMTDNSYSMAVASFIKQKCQDCKDVMIIGDDFVVPHYRNQFNVDYNWLPFIDRITNHVIYTDQNYITVKGTPPIKELDLIFTQEGRREDKQVMFIVPDEIDLELRQSIDHLKNVIENKFQTDDITERKGSELIIGDYGAPGTTLVIIGDLETNAALSYYPFALGTEYDMFIDRNLWDPNRGFLQKEEYALIMVVDSPYELDLNTGVIESEMYKKINGEAINWVALGGGTILVVISPFTGPAAPFVAVAGIAMLSADTVDNCLIENQAGQNWDECSADIILDVATAGVFKLLKPYAKPIAQRFGKTVADQILARINNLGKHINPKAIETVTKESGDELINLKYIAKGTEILSEGSDEILERSLKDLPGTANGIIRPRFVKNLGEIAAKHGDDVAENVRNLRKTKKVEIWSKNIAENPDPIDDIFEVKGAIKIKNQGYEIVEAKGRVRSLLNPDNNWEFDSLAFKNGKNAIIESKSLRPGNIFKPEIWINKHITTRSNKLKNMWNADDLIDVVTKEERTLKNVNELIFTIPKDALDEMFNGKTLRRLIKNSIDELNNAGAYPFRIKLVEVLP